MIEMNIGLDVEGEANNQWTRSLRVGAAIRVLTEDHAQFDAIEIIGDMAGSDEPCLYVQFKSWNQPEFVIHRIAKQLQQDCIATVIGGEGKLIGPNAAAWGEFNPAFFRRPAIAVAA